MQIIGRGFALIAINGLKVARQTDMLIAQTAAQRWT